MVYAGSVSSDLACGFLLRLSLAISERSMHTAESNGFQLQSAILEGETITAVAEEPDAQPACLSWLPTSIPGHSGVLIGTLDKPSNRVSSVAPMCGPVLTKERQL